MVMFFGMCNSPGTLQQMMNDIFTDMLITFLVIFMDNLSIATKNLTTAKHLNKAQQVLQWLRDHSLCLKPSKCLFAKLEVEFLGMIVSAMGVCIDENKIL